MTESDQEWTESGDSGEVFWSLRDLSIYRADRDTAFFLSTDGRAPISRCYTRHGTLAEAKRYAEHSDALCDDYDFEALKALAGGESDQQ